MRHVCARAAAGVNRLNFIKSLAAVCKLLLTRAVLCVVVFVWFRAQVHHDTGFWVHKTHRCHAPIVTNGGVVFRAGPTEALMARYGLAVGGCFELNNQAKHYVSNWGETERVHLILDYVDDDTDLPPLEVGLTHTGWLAGGGARRTGDAAAFCLVMSCCVQQKLPPGAATGLAPDTASAF